MTKKQKLKEKVRSLGTQNLSLQSEVERLNKEIQQQLVVSKSLDHQHASASEPSKTNIQNERLKLLEKRIASQLSDDGVSVDSVYYFFPRNYRQSTSYYFNLFTLYFHSKIKCFVIAFYLITLIHSFKCGERQSLVDGNLELNNSSAVVLNIKKNKGIQFAFK